MKKRRIKLPNVTVKARRRVYSKPIKLPNVKSLFSKIYSAKISTRPIHKKTPQSKLLKPRKAQLFTNPLAKSNKKKCKYKLADNARRSNFFSSKNRGGSARPEHRQKHERIC